MKSHILVLGLLFIFSMIACEAPNEEAITGPKVVDIEDIFERQYKVLAEKGAVLKRARINDSTESRTVELTADEWKRELKFFTNSDINRKSWVDYFKIDTQHISNNNITITYSTERDNIPVKKAKVRQDKNGNTTFLSMSIERSNPISGLDRKLIYAFPDSIIIENKESLWLVGDQTVKIRYTWPDSLK